MSGKRKQPILRQIDAVSLLAPPLLCLFCEVRSMYSYVMLIF